MFGPRIRVTAPAVAGLCFVRGRPANAGAAPVPRTILGTVKRLKVAPGGPL
jgi:hypothetical protein